MKSPFLTLGMLVAGLALAHAEDVKVSTFVFDTAGVWKDVGSGAPMRAAELQFDVEGDDDPVAVFYYFGMGQGGGVEANITRWKGQFQGGPTDEERQDLDGKGVLLELTGTYLDGPPFGGQKTPKPGYKMLAAILPSDQGAVFVKLTASEAAAAEVRGPFEDLVRSALD